MITPALTRPAPAGLPEPNRPTSPPGSAGPVTLVCLHHAGGNSSAFREWRNALPEGFVAHPVRLPGRDGPVTTPRRHPGLAALVRELDEQLAEEVPCRYAVFGHSMGAMLAFWLVQRRMARGGPLPELFLAAAYAAPHLAGSLLGVTSEDAVDALDDVTLAERLRAAGGLPAELLARPQWLRLLLGTVREDLRLCAAHRYVAAPRLPMPVHVFGGRRDPIVSVEQLRGWREHAAGDFGCEILDGGHFLVQEPHAGLLPALRRRLTRTVPGPQAVGASPGPRTVGPSPSPQTASTSPAPTRTK
ncbi:hypothetical protein B7C62_15900 [Kitasatospora albolonga]|uniref:Thioesterase domain-containing protein n=1 Tax=Kitasatospora albolonga TaxID=68173 RepID=A0ABC8BT07_9ACTN|nr:hypothetical protein B7C62_15900 [Kitasatospora albolonga]